jgi:hypothetical protein
VIRTVWLGLSFLILLAGVGSFRFAFGHFDAANALGIVGPDLGHVADRTVQETLTAADRVMPLAYISSVPVVAMEQAAPELPELSVSTPSIIVSTPSVIVPLPVANPRLQKQKSVSAAMAQAREPHARDTKSKPRPAKKGAVADSTQAAPEPKACQAAEFDAVRWVFDVPTGCRS